MADRDLVRLIINDLSEPPTFDDGELDQFLELEGGVKLAAAQALDTIASNEALVLKRIVSLDLQTDGPAVAKALREHAAALRKQVQHELEIADDEAGGAFEFTERLGTRHFRHGLRAELTEPSAG